MRSSMAEAFRANDISEVPEFNSATSFLPAPRSHEIVTTPVPAAPAVRVVVAVPNGIRSGETFPVEFGNRFYDILCPRGHYPGDEFEVELPKQWGLAKLRAVASAVHAFAPELARLAHTAPMDIEDMAVRVVVIVPESCVAGDTFPVSFQNRYFNVLVPTGFDPGDEFEIELPKQWGLAKLRSCISAVQASVQLAKLSKSSDRPWEYRARQSVEALLTDKSLRERFQRRHFANADVDGDGALQYEEVADAIAAMCDELAVTPPSDVDELIANFDANRDGVLSQREFRKLLDDTLRAAHHQLVGHIARLEERIARVHSLPPAPPPPRPFGLNGVASAS